VGKRIRGKERLRRKAAKRVPSAKPPDPSGELFIGWRFEQIDFESEWGWRTMSPACTERLRQELVTFEKEPLRTLKDKRWVKFIPIREMVYGAKDRLEEIGRDDEGLWQLHLGYDKWRVWGFLDEGSGAFYFLWWDPDHGVATGKCRNRQS
jgi:hypothetical protein